LSEQGRSVEGIAEMRRGGDAIVATGFASRPRWLVFLAEASAKTEGPGEGLRLLDEGMALLDSSQERMYEPENSPAPG
jgi:hypothetical protein